MSILINAILPYSAIKPYRVDASSLPEFKNGVLPSDYGLSYESFSIQTFDTLSLKCFYIKADKPKGTIILLHGIGDCKEHFYAFSKRLSDIHFNSVLIDSRAHGQSEGEYCTFGFKEKKGSMLISVEKVVLLRYK